MSSSARAFEVMRINETPIEMNLFMIFLSYNVLNFVTNKIYDG